MIAGRDCGMVKERAFVARCASVQVLRRGERCNILVRKAVSPYVFYFVRASCLGASFVLTG